MAEVTISGSQMLIALLIGILFLIFMIMKTKIHTFLALIIAAIFIGIVGGMPTGMIMKSITDGFGGTLGSIGIIIGFGVMMGEIFEVSGAAKRMALTFLKMFGKNKEEVALATTGFLVSIPIFCDSGFVILSPLAKALSRQTKKSVITLGVALAAGLVITHSLVPPTPGPVGVAGIFGVNVGSIILWGIVIAVPMVITTLMYAKYIGKKIYQLPNPDGEEGYYRPEKPEIPQEINVVEESRGLPSTFASFAPIVVPIILILLNTVLTVVAKGNPIAKVFIFLGTPIVAVGIGLVIAIYALSMGRTRSQVISDMERGITTAGIIILVTGGGGALGMVLRNSGVGTYIADIIMGTPIPLIILPILVATLLRFIQGSGTVAMTTAASITAPILVGHVDPLFAALGCCIGSLFFSYFNDSYFWVVNRILGISDAKEQIKIWSVTTTIAWGTGVVVLLVLNAIFG